MSKEQTPTPHIGAGYGEIADTVLMAGDPLRARFMAETFLEKPVQYNNVRGMLGYTGYYNGKRVSVQGHGMGMPSIGIYSYELYRFYDVERIIRIGSIGAFDMDLKTGDLILAMGACTDSDYGHQYGMPAKFAPIADFGLLQAAVNAADRLGVRYKVGNVYATDVFYDESEAQKQWARFGVLGVEMESAALYINAAALGKKALTICTVSDHIFTHQTTTAQERERNFTDMMKVALSII